MSDRTIHGLTADAGWIVRYDRGGKWYVEYPDYTLKACRHITVGLAADLACETGGTAYVGEPGGRRFDALVRGLGGSDV